MRVGPGESEKERERAHRFVCGGESLFGSCGGHAKAQLAAEAGPIVKSLDC